MSTLSPHAVQRVHDVTANFFFWQGLRWVPMGAALLAVAWGLSPATPVPDAWQAPLLLTSMVVSLGLSALAGRWYARSYGRVRARPGMHTRRTRTKWLVVYPLVAVALIIDGVWKLPVLASGFALAGAIEAYRRSTGGGRRHYIVASAMFVALAFVPALGLVTPGALALDLVVGLLGATYVIGGVLDHFELRRVLPGAGDGDDLTEIVAGVQ